MIGRGAAFQNYFPLNDLEGILRLKDFMCVHCNAYLLHNSMSLYERHKSLSILQRKKLPNKLYNGRLVMERGYIFLLEP